MALTGQVDATGESSEFAQNVFRHISLTSASVSRMTQSNAHTPRFNAGALLACCTVSFACFFGSYLRIPVVPLYAAEIGASTAQVGRSTPPSWTARHPLRTPLRAHWPTGGHPRWAADHRRFLLPALPEHHPRQDDRPLFSLRHRPSGLLAVDDVLRRRHRPQHPSLGAYGMCTLASNVAMMLGPASGGLLCKILGLRAVFLVSGVLRGVRKLPHPETG